MAESSEQLIGKLKEKAMHIRKHILHMTTKAQSGHPGGSMSATEILTTLYFYKMKFDPKNLSDPNRDRFLLSKGHCSPVMYATLSELGVIPVKELDTFRQINSRLSGHVARHLTPGVEMSFGSLGQGLAVANGIALAAKHDKKNFKIYVLMGDGETEEGMVWESVMFADYRKLNNIVVIVDRNKIQNDTFTADEINIDSLEDKFKAFHWNAVTVDGHDFKQLMDALDKADKSEKPFAIIAMTAKGKGISFMENDPQWHGKALSPEQFEKAMAEFEKK